MSRAARAVESKAVVRIEAAGGKSPAAKSPPSIPCRASPRHPEVLLLSRGRFPEGHRIGTPRVLSARRRFSPSARSQHTRSPACVWCFCRQLALFSAIAHGISSIIGPLSISSLLSQVPRLVVFNVPGCSACGLGYPHAQVWWTPPTMYIARAWPQ
jgi:hypothetical protein